MLLPALAATQSFGYVTPSQPQTGSRRKEQISPRGAQVPGPPQRPAGREQYEPRAAHSASEEHALRESSQAPSKAMLLPALAATQSFG